ncbi:MAG: hypothetical protein KAX31_04605, partial [Thermoplasmata archaeon]|nr:hypothetical protein [Thermoplasmata archaeon]
TPESEGKMTGLDIPMLIEKIQELGTPDDVSGYNWPARYEYLIQLAALKQEVQRAIDRTILTLSKWNDETYAEGLSLANIQSLVLKEMKTDINLAQMIQGIKREFGIEVSSE